MGRYQYFNFSIMVNLEFRCVNQYVHGVWVPIYLSVYLKCQDYGDVKCRSTIMAPNNVMKKKCFKMTSKSVSGHYLLWAEIIRVRLGLD